MRITRSRKGATAAVGAVVVVVLEHFPRWCLQEGVIVVTAIPGDTASEDRGSTRGSGGSGL